MPIERGISFEAVCQSLKRCVATLRDADVPFLVGGSAALWARGGPQYVEDLDFIVKPTDAERALDALVEAGLESKRPPEEWLLMAREDIFTTKLLSLKEHYLDYEGLLPFARALREQVDWADVRERTSESPFAKAFFVLIEELGILS